MNLNHNPWKIKFSSSSSSSLSLSLSLPPYNKYIYCNPVALSLHAASTTGHHRLSKQVVPQWTPSGITQGGTSLRQLLVLLPSPQGPISRLPCGQTSGAWAEFPTQALLLWGLKRIGLLRTSSSSSSFFLSFFLLLLLSYSA